MSELESIPTPDFDNCKFDYTKLLKERTEKSANSLCNKEYKTTTSKINDEINISETKDKHLYDKSDIKSILIKKHCICNHCPNIIFKNNYDQEHMIKFIREKVAAFEGSELENETIENEQD